MAVNLGSIYAEIRLRMDQLAGDIARAKAELRTASGFIENMAQEAAIKLQNRLQNVSETIRGVGTAVTGVGVGIAGVLGSAVKTTADFDKEMSRVRALSGATEAEFQKLRQAAIQLGADSVFSASEAAQGMSVLAAAGFNTNQILAAMPGLLDAAAASGEDFASVADIMVATMSGFGLQAKDMSHIADVLAAAANASSVSIRDLGYTFKYIAPNARAAGQSLEMMAAAAAILGNAGIKADQAGTTLRMALIRLADPPKEAAKWLEKLGIQVTDSSGRMLPLSDIIGQLNRAFKGLSQQEQIAAASAIFGAEAMSGMMALIQAGPEELNRLTKAFENSNGAAKKMAEEMNNNLAGAWEEFKGAIESLAINIGEQLTPILRTITEALTGLVRWFNSLPKPIQKVIAIVLALVAAFALIGGPILLFLGFLPSIVAGVGMVSTAFAALVGAIGPVIAIFGALVAAAGVVYLALKTNFTGMLKSAASALKSMGAHFLSFLGLLAQFGKRFIAILGSALVAGFRWIASFGAKGFSAFASFVSRTLSLMGRWAANLASKAWAAMTGMLRAIGRGLSSILSRFSQFVSSAIRSVGRLAGNMVSIGKNIASGLWNGIKSMTGAIKKRVVSWVKSVVPDPIRKALGIHSPSRVMAQYGKNVAQGLAKGMEQGKKVVENTAEQLAGIVESINRREELLRLQGEVELQKLKLSGVEEDSLTFVRRQREVMMRVYDTLMNGVKRLQAIIPKIQGEQRVEAQIELLRLQQKANDILLEIRENTKNLRSTFGLPSGIEPMRLFQYRAMESGTKGITISTPQIVVHLPNVKGGPDMGRRFVEALEAVLSARLMADIRAGR